MCLLAVALNVHSQYKLIVCSNRDEFYGRASSRAAFWEGDKNVFAGKDLVKGGTWAGVTKEGKFAAVTNVREAVINQAECSRGALVSNFLTTDLEVKHYLKQVTKQEQLYQGYNFIFGKGDDWYYMSNRSSTRKLENGIHVVSNADLFTDWPKTIRLKKQIKEICQKCEQENELIKLCMNVLKNDEIFNDHLLPDTGVGLHLERQLSPIFIKSETYGTRASTIILIRNNGKIRFIEQGYGPNGKRWERIDQEIN
ncbi:NRDE family protein [Halalkalibacter krulwichiae]|uniref:NRDE family protein n=1 Tax=Halalkalibacter krulwichiae TaxID=199441 RepID=A0A1X9MAE9_9BACI|nr:NRDE family protein [Halalkalibacter krulwichiae]ARK30377.1 hypothetical protein BkAM31D_11360 [Halalkalibacter krulwichiae]